MQRIILMRHAKSDWTQPGQHDKQRMLNERGRATAPRMAQWLVHQNYLIDQVHSSSSARTRETWALMSPILESTSGSSEMRSDSTASATSKSVPIQFSDELYLGSANALWKQVIAFFNSLEPLRSKSDWTLMLIAHNPGLELLVRALANQEVEFPTASIAVFEREGNRPVEELIPTIENNEWNLSNLQFPKQLVD